MERLTLSPDKVVLSSDFHEVNSVISTFFSFFSRVRACVLMMMKRESGANLLLVSASYATAAMTR